MNQPLPQNAHGVPVYNGGYALLPMIGEPKGEIIFVMAFSGGGKRSAAFAHGVLRGLKQIPVVEGGVRRSLLDEVDYIAAVSGGSFPAMHYALYRDRSFETFPSEFLKQDINSYIYATYLLPWNWEWLINPYYGTNDRMAEIYDRLMFHGATYAELLRQGLATRRYQRHRYRQWRLIFVHPTLFRSDLLRPLKLSGRPRGRREQRLSGPVFADHPDKLQHPLPDQSADRRRRPRNGPIRRKSCRVGCCWRGRRTAISTGAHQVCPPDGWRHLG